MKQLSAKDKKTLLEILQTRFETHRHRHKKIGWEAVAAKLQADPKKLWSLSELERTGGEPDVVGYDQATDTYRFVDCAAESPAGRRSLCFDQAALQSRKEHKPESSALQLANAMGVAILTEAEYRALQKLEPCDTKTSSWIATPEPVRKLGGALFCDRRYDQVFVYHNGAESYYAGRGFRASLIV